MRRDAFKKARMIISITAGVVLLAVLSLLAFDSRLLIRRYTVNESEITAPIRIALVTDLHSCAYGEGQKDLIDAIVREAPDVVLLGGDIFDNVLDDGNTEHFLSGIVGKYACYYVTGNHEFWSGQQNFAAKMAILGKYNIPILSGKSEMLTVNGQTVRLCGVDDPEAYTIAAEGETVVGFADQLTIVAPADGDDMCTILLSHRPEYFETYAAHGFDLILCGHAHGGQWRIPFLLNGLYAPNQGLFPKYAGGKYEREGSVMIVSRGLARETTCVPRIWNRPELVIIDLQ